jgi:hypothetical protein
LNLEEMQRLYLDANGKPWYVDDQPEDPPGGTRATARGAGEE